ncbi:hypothetical protein [Methyloglobulus morosus]|uniref:hypothetical protein n=1 Tax=Methyloglobulus morosus TaxID=1410681 RepID=UPI00137B9156|nr:hypothetical protein [Methyloglobulus morosus]
MIFSLRTGILDTDGKAQCQCTIFSCLRCFRLGGVRPSAQAMTAFIDGHRDVYGVGPIDRG